MSAFVMERTIPGPGSFSAPGSHAIPAKRVGVLRDEAIIDPTAAEV